MGKSLFIMYHCEICGKSYKRSSNLNHHVNSIHKKIKYSCTFCDKVYTSKSYLKRHEKIHQPLSRPNPAQLNPTPNSLADTSSSVSDPQQLPVALSDILLDTEFDDFIKNHISSIYRYKNQRSKSCIFNRDLKTSSLSRLDLMKIFKAHRCVFKINASAGFVLRHKITGKYKYFHSSPGRKDTVLPYPVTISNKSEFSDFVNLILNLNLPDFLKTKSPDSSWQLFIVTNLTVYTFLLQDHPLRT